MSGRWLRAVVASCALAAASLAQADAERQQADLARHRRALQQSRTEVDRLLDLRLRHDLGLPADTSDRAFRASTPVTTEAVERMHQELADEDNATASLLTRYEQVRAEVEKLRAEAAAMVPDNGGIDVPRAGTPVEPGSPVGGRRPAPAPVDAKPGTDAAAPAAAATTDHPPASALDPATLATTLDPLRAQIHGSTDHQRVAHALYKAGQALMDRATAVAEQGHAAAAKDLDDRGKERLLRALDELKPVLAAAEPPFEALFCRGRCLELLFRHAERHDGLSVASSARDWQRREQEVRDPFLQITARDVVKAGARGESDVLGSWGKAAQSAIEHFRWMNLNAGYDARATIRALTWPGEREQ